MIKNKKGITLVALTITIIVLLMLAGITISLGSDSINESRDKKLLAEVEMIQQAAITEYTKASQLGLLGTGTIPSNFVGTTVSVSSLNALINWEVTADEILADISKSYFRLTQDNLADLNITSSTSYTFIVNYYSGEVYNESKKTSEDETVYISGSNADRLTDSGDTTSFTN